MKSLRSLLALFLIVAALYALWVLLPPFMANYQLEDAMDSAARFAVLDYRKTDQAIRDDIMKEARSLNIPISPEHVFVQRDNDAVQIWGDYTVHVDMPLYPFDLHFQPMSKSRKRL